MMSPIRVVLVDDHPVVRDGIRAYLQRRPGLDIVGEATDGVDAVRLARGLTPDVVLMDVRLPDGSGVAACREILASCPETRVLFLSSYADDDSVLAAVVAGAQGYLLKEINSSALIGAIEAVSEGQSILDPTVTQRALAWIKKCGRSPQVMAGAEPLSPQEERVLALVAEGKTNKEIANNLDLSEKTVKNHVRNIFHKLQVYDRTQAAILAIRKGLIELEPRP